MPQIAFQSSNARRARASGETRLAASPITSTFRITAPGYGAGRADPTHTMLAVAPGKREDFVPPFRPQAVQGAPAEERGYTGSQAFPKRPRGKHMTILRMVAHPVNQRLITCHPGIGKMLPHLFE